MFENAHSQSRLRRPLTLFHIISSLIFFQKSFFGTFSATHWLSRGCNNCIKKEATTMYITHPKNRLLLVAILLVNITISLSTLGNQITHNVNNDSVTITSPDITDFVILHLAKDGALKGGYFMDKTGPGNFSLPFPLSEDLWNEYKFVYMTNEGQKESPWHDRNMDAPDTPPISDIPVTPAPSSNYFPIKFVNNTGRSSSDIYLAMTGRLPDNENIIGHLNFNTSKMVAVKASDNDPQNDDKCAGYTERLSNIQKIGEKTYLLNVPRFVSGRLYISVGKPLPFHINGVGGLVEPTAIAEDQVTSAGETIYDIIEMTWKPGENLFVNTSNVDFFSIPFKIQMNLNDGTQVIRGYDLSRSEIFNRAASMDPMLSDCIVRDGNGQVLRLLGGTLGTFIGFIPENYLQPAIDNAWNNFNTIPLNTSFEGWNISAEVRQDGLLHVNASHQHFGNEYFTIAKPTSAEAFGGDGVLSSGSIIEKKIQAFISAAIHRGVFHDGHSWWDRSKYYIGNESNADKYNKYAEFLHSVSIEGRCYGFSYDDVNGQDPSIWLPNQKELIITIPSMSTASTPNDNVIAGNDFATAEQNATVTIDVLSNDYSSNGNTLRITEVSSPSNGNIAMNGALLYYTPNTDFYGNDSFSYTVTNDVNTATATVTVSVEKNTTTPTGPAADSITAEDDFTTTNQNATATINVLANDFCSAGYSLTITGTGNPLNGSITRNAGVISYTPNTDFHGTDHFSYTVSNGFNTATANVSVTIDKQVSNELNHKYENNTLYVSSPVFSGHVIAHLAQEEVIKGGYYMNDGGSKSFSVTNPLPEINWNKYRFVYMTNEGQKESEWFERTSTNTGTSGGTTSGGTTSGGTTSGGTTSGGTTSGGTTSGGTTSGGTTGTGNNVFMYSLENNTILANSSAITGHVIVHLSKSGSMQGGYFMNDNGNGNFTLPYPIHENNWNEYRFVYVTNEGQKETEWITRASSSTNTGGSTNTGNSSNNNTTGGNTSGGNTGNDQNTGNDPVTNYGENNSPWGLISQDGSTETKGVYIFNDSMSMNKIQETINSIYHKQRDNEFGSERYVLLFKPGHYNQIDVKVGYYTQVLGLGKSPNDVIITGAVRTQDNFRTNPVDAGPGSLDNFWRSCENLRINPTLGSMNPQGWGIPDHQNVWAVSQAAPIRRVHVTSNPYPGGPDEVSGLRLFDIGWTSGGYMANCKIDESVISGSQQQWLSRNSEWKQWLCGNWNMVFVGCKEEVTTNSNWDPKTDGYNWNPVPPVGKPWVNSPYTSVGLATKMVEKPFLVFENGDWGVMLPPVREKGSTGVDWREGTVLPMSGFYIAKKDDTATTINSKVQEGKNLIFSPGVYENLNGGIVITNSNSNSIVLGLGLPSLISSNAQPCMIIKDNVSELNLGGIMFEAGEEASTSLLQIGESVDKTAKPAIYLYDVFCRVGGASMGTAESCVIVNRNNVIGDNLWIWRADHDFRADRNRQYASDDKRGLVLWNENQCPNGITVNGNDVTVYGLAVEHFQKYQTIWNGENGKVYFYQSEIPYDVPSQAAWMSNEGKVAGYPSYKIGNNVNNHEAWGVGIYCFFREADNVFADNAIEAPEKPGISFNNMMTVWLNGLGELSEGTSGIKHIINGKGLPVTESVRRSALDSQH